MKFRMKFANNFFLIIFDNFLYKKLTTKENIYLKFNIIKIIKNIK